MMPNRLCMLDSIECRAHVFRTPHSRAEARRSLVVNMWIDQMVYSLDAPICHCLPVDEGDLSSAASTQMEVSVSPSLLGSFQRKAQYSYCAVLYLCPC